MTGLELNLTEHAGFEPLAESVAETLAQACRDGLESDRAPALALAGGSTPLPIYRRLAGQTLDWPRITLLPTDERWVDADLRDSNLRSIRECLAGTGARLQSLIPGAVAGEPSADHARQMLAGWPGPFDAVVLGMGADGHFASLFPHAAALATGLAAGTGQPALVVMPASPPEGAPHPRITLSLERLLNANRIVLVITGGDKRATLERAARADADWRDLPVAALIARAAGQLQVHWSP